MSIVGLLEERVNQAHYRAYIFTRNSDTGTQIKLRTTNKLNSKINREVFWKQTLSTQKGFCLSVMHEWTQLG